MKNYKLKPCPFCGKPGKVIMADLVGCTDVVNCGALIEGDANQPNAEKELAYCIKRWNTRINPSEGENNS